MACYNYSKGHEQHYMKAVSIRDNSEYYTCMHGSKTKRLLRTTKDKRTNQELIV